VTGDDGTKLQADETFLTTSPYLLDSLYVVGGSSKNQEHFNYELKEYINVAYRHYKPIGVASTEASYFQTTENNNLAGVVFAAKDPDFERNFVTAIAHQRFWDRS
jgi:catalase